MLYNQGWAKSETTCLAIIFFDDIVEEQRKLEDNREREMRERFEFGFAGEMAGVSFRNTREKVEIGQNETQEEE